MIYTFYSYKGGVGRSMALVNVAELMYRAGLKVLMVDWDLEAPGLERFYPSKIKRVLDSPGIIDMLLDYKDKASRYKPDSGISLFPVHNVRDYLIDMYPETYDSGGLWLLPAGRRDENHFFEYANRIKSFDWQDFYQHWEGEVYFEWLRKELDSIADAVLIDSRTGVTEMGGVCTYQLADVVVMLCAANDQNIDGTLQLVKSFSDPRLPQLRYGRELATLVVPARIERLAETKVLNKFRKRFAQCFAQYVPGELRGDAANFVQLEIPYVPLYAFEEIIAVNQSETLERAVEMEQAYTRLLQVLSRLAADRLASEPVSLRRRFRRLAELSPDILLAQATCAVLIDGKVKGTAWLVSDEGHLLTAGHVLGTSVSRDEVEVQFSEDVPRKAYRIQWGYQQELGIDFSVLKVADPPENRQPLPISLERAVSGSFRSHGYGTTLKDQSAAKGEFVGPFDPQNSPGYRLFELCSPGLSEGGFSGAPVFSDNLQAVVAIQIEATKSVTGAGRETILAMPLYRVAQLWEPLSRRLETFDVFLAHSSADKAAVEELAYTLVKAGIQPWLDTWNLIPGEPWQEAMEEALGACQTVAVFLGPSGVGPWENEETRATLEEESARGEVRRVIPVLLPGAPDPIERPLPRFLRRLTWVDFRNGLDDADAYHRLLSGIRGEAPGRPARSTTGIRPQG